MNGPTWCVLELFGHRQIAGLVEQVELAGEQMLRVEVPCRPGTEDDREDWPAVRYFSGKAVYSLTPVTEAKARELAERLQPRKWDAPQLLAPTDLTPEDFESVSVPVPAECDGCNDASLDPGADGWRQVEDCAGVLWMCPECFGDVVEQATGVAPGSAP